MHEFKLEEGLGQRDWFFYVPDQDGGKDAFQLLVSLDHDNLSRCSAVSVRVFAWNNNSIELDPVHHRPLPRAPEERITVSFQSLWLQTEVSLPIDDLCAWPCAAPPRATVLDAKGHWVPVPKDTSCVYDFEGARHGAGVVQGVQVRWLQAAKYPALQRSGQVCVKYHRAPLPPPPVDTDSD